MSKPTIWWRYRSREVSLARHERTGIPLAVRKRWSAEGSGSTYGRAGAPPLRLAAGALGHWGTGRCTTGGGGPPSGLCGVQRWYAGTISRILRWAPAA